MLNTDTFGPFAPVLRKVVAPATVRKWAHSVPSSGHNHTGITECNSSEGKRKSRWVLFPCQEHRATNIWGSGRLLMLTVCQKQTNAAIGHQHGKAPFWPVSGHEHQATRQGGNEAMSPGGLAVSVAHTVALLHSKPAYLDHQIGIQIGMPSVQKTQKGTANDGKASGMMHSFKVLR